MFNASSMMQRLTWIISGAILILGIASAASAAGDRWTRKTDMPTPRINLSSGAVNGMVYAIGGWNNEELSILEAYDTGYRPQAVDKSGKLMMTWGYIKGYR